MFRRIALWLAPDLAELDAENKELRSSLEEADEATLGWMQTAQTAENQLKTLSVVRNKETEDAAIAAVRNEISDIFVRHYESVSSRNHVIDTELRKFYRLILEGIKNYPIR